MGIAEIPRLYKAQGLAYKRSLESEEWGIVHKRISTLVDRVERLYSRLLSFGLGLPEAILSQVDELSRAVERGDLSEAIERYERLADYVKNIGAAIEVYSMQAWVIRLTAAVTLLVAAGFSLLSLGAEASPYSILVLSLGGGLAVSALLLHRLHESIYILLGSSAIIMVYAVSNIGFITIDVMTTIIFAVSVSIFSVVHTVYTRTLIRGIIEKWVARA